MKTIIRLSLLAAITLAASATANAGVISLIASNIDINHSNGFGVIDGVAGSTDGTGYDNTLTGGGGSSTGDFELTTYTSYGVVGFDALGDLGVSQSATTDLAGSSAILDVSLTGAWETDLFGFPGPTSSWVNMPSVSGYVSAGGSVQISYSFIFYAATSLDPIGDLMTDTITITDVGAFNFSIYELQSSPTGAAGLENVAFSGSMSLSAYDGTIGGDESFINVASMSVVPVPAAVWLFASALGGLGFLRRTVRAGH